MVTADYNLDVSVETDDEEESLSSHFADHDRFLYENLLRSTGVFPRTGESFESFLNRNWL